MEGGLLLLAYCLLHIAIAISVCSSVLLLLSLLLLLYAAVYYYYYCYLLPLYYYFCFITFGRPPFWALSTYVRGGAKQSANSKACAP